MDRAPPVTADVTAQDRSIRLFVGGDLAEGLEIALSEAQAHYLGAVMRSRQGATVRVFNGRDGEHLAKIRTLRRAVCLLSVEQQLRTQEPESDIWLAFALLKRTHTELVVQKATELGVAAILPVITTRTNAERVNQPRLMAIATEAAEQSERLGLPALHPPCPLETMLSRWPADRRLVVCMERQADATVAPLHGKPGGLLIGPEGGFTERELDAVRAAPFVVPASLGRRILRAETAAIAGLVLLQAG